MEVKRFKRFLALLLMVVTIVASSMMKETQHAAYCNIPLRHPVRFPHDVNGNSGKTVVKYTGKNAVKYQIQYKASHNTGWVTKTTTKTNYTINLKHNGLYDIRVRAIGKDGKVGKWCTITNRYVNAVKPKYSTAKTKKIVVKTAKTSGVTGFAIYYSTNKKMTNAKKVVVKKNYTNKPIAAVKGKTYYIKVVPFVQKNGKTYWGAASAVTAVKAK